MSPTAKMGLNSGGPLAQSNKLTGFAIKQHLLAELWVLGLLMKDIAILLLSLHLDDFLM